MRNGEGSITEKKRPDGKSYNPKRWQICVSYTVKVLDSEGNTTSKRIRRQAVAHGPKSAAIALRQEIIDAHDDDGNPINEFQQAINEEGKQAEKKITFNEMIEQWQLARHTSGKAAEKTIREDRVRLNRLAKYFGHLELNEITPQMVVQAYAGIQKEFNLGGTSMNHIHVLLKGVFTQAVNYDLMLKNPCCCIDAPRRDEPRRRSLTVDEGIKLQTIINETEEAAYAALAAKEERREVREENGTARDRSALRGINPISSIIAVRLGLATGMRRAEVIALCWKHIDFEKHTVRVSQSATMQGTVKKPKTAAGMRTLAIDEITLKHLERWKAVQSEQLEKISIKTSKETPICCTDVGTMMRLDNFERWWRNWRNKAGFPDLKFHELRHTQATMLLANGVDVKTVQTRLGHANPSITLGWYAHAIPENDHEAANMLGNLFNKQAENKVQNQQEIDGQMEEMSSKCLPNCLPESLSISKSEKMSSKCLPKFEDDQKKASFRLIKQTA